MKARILLLIIMLIPLISEAQKPAKLKRRHYGSYSGTIAGFQMDTGSDLVEVSPTDININLTKTNVLITIGAQKLSGSYVILFQGDNYFVLDADIQGQLANERIVVYNRGKKISRDGMFPQPNATLYKD